MIRIDLTPAYWRKRKQQQAIVRRCALGTAAYSLLMLACCILLRVVWGHGDPAITDSLAKIRIEIDSTRRITGDIQAAVEESERLLKANLQVREHPDWSLLLGLLAKNVGDNLVLRACELEEVTVRQAGSSTAIPIANPGPSSNEGKYRLAIRGLGQSQAAVAEFTLRLERIGLFDEVKLVDTSLEPFLAQKAIAFRLECLFGSPRGGTP